MSLHGFDDIESSKFFGLSTVRVLFEEIGEKAAEMAIKLIRYEEMGPEGSGYILKRCKIFLSYL